MAVVQIVWGNPLGWCPKWEELGHNFFRAYTRRLSDLFRKRYVDYCISCEHEEPAIHRPVSSLVPSLRIARRAREEGYYLGHQAPRPPEGRRYS